MMKIVVMSVGDLAYEDVLPAREGPGYNLTSSYQQLRSQYGEFEFVRQLPVDPPVNVAQTDESRILAFPPLSYLLYICFAILMPVVVLNVLVCLSLALPFRLTSGGRSLQWYRLVLLSETLLPYK